MLIGFSSCSTSKYYQGNPEDTYQYEQEPTITYQQFYNDLSPYGNWINYGNYGYVWQPYINNFRPYYTNGHWVYTQYGWTWASNYNWGWAPFHYGRWINDMSYGWMWVPGYEWAPAWVSWRGGGDYYGWAPLGPGMNANYAGSLPYNYWTFVPGRYINSSRINDYYVNSIRNATIINNTRIINNTTQSRNRPSYNQGPTVREVQRITGAPIRKLNVEEANKPESAQVNNNSIRVFRPVVNEKASSRPGVRPEKVTDLNQLRRTSDQNQESNTDNEKNTRPAPVREFPKNQTPQVNRNEPPVNNVPVTRDPSPADVSPRVQQNRNVEPEKQNNQSAPVRNLNNTQSQRSTVPVQQNQIKKNDQPAERPVRRMPANKQPTQPARQNESRTNTPPANNVRQNPVKSTPSRQPARTFNTNPPSTSQPKVEKKEVREVRPAQNVRRVDANRH